MATIAAMPFYDYLIAFAALSLIILVRYLLVAGFFFWALWMRPEEKVRARRLYKERPSVALMKSELGWSLISSLIYALPGAYMLEAWKLGTSLIYSDISLYPWWYLPASVVVYLFVHDTYFYWTHRLMHLPKLFPIFHKVHHQSLQPTPWAAFSFHPYESVVGALIVPFLTFIIPIHIGAVLFILTLMTVSSVLNHSGYEIVPDRWLRGWFGLFFITAAHHNLHHARYRCNYALYFRFWDQIMGTDQFKGAYPFLREQECNIKASG